MPTAHQATVSPDGGSRNGGFGTRSDTNLKAIFSASPMYNEYTTETVQNIGIAALNGNGGPGDNVPNIGVVNGIVSDGGHAFGTFNLNYGGSQAPDFVPNLNDVVTGGGGLPASPYMPNPTSPGPGSTSAATQAPYTGDIPNPGVEFGSGLGGTTSPSTTSPSVATQTIGSYLSGRSYAGSDGTA